jgi:hypothetical protein
VLNGTKRRFLRCAEKNIYFQGGGHCLVQRQTSITEYGVGEDDRYGFSLAVRIAGDNKAVRFFPDQKGV